MSRIPCCIPLVLTQKNLFTIRKMLVQNVPLPRTGQTNPREPFIANSKDFSHNDIMHKNHQCTSDLPPARTNVHHGHSPSIQRLSNTELHPSVKGLWNLIENNPEVHSLFTQMLQQVPNTPPYDKTPFGGAQARNWRDLLHAFNDQLSQGPVWLYDTPGQQGLIGFSFNVLLVRYRNLSLPVCPTPSSASRL